MKFSILKASIILIFVSCKGLAMEEDDTNYDVLQDQILKATSKKLEQLFGFEITGFGGGSAGALKKLNLSGEVAAPYTIEKARRTMVTATEIFLKNINQMKPLRPHMTEFPFPLNGIELSFYVNTGNVIGTGELTGFGLFRGKIHYDTLNSLTNKFDTIFTETFEEAKKIVEKDNDTTQALVNQQKCDVAYDISSELGESYKQGWKSLKKEIYCGRSVQENMLWSIDNFCTELSKTNNLNFIEVGNFTNSFRYFYGLSFFGHQKYTLEECRKETIPLFDKILTFLRTTPEILKSHALQKKHRPHFALDEVPSLNDICFRITFWDKNFDRWAPPYISEVCFSDNKFQYFDADATTQELRPVFQESYEEAIAFKNQHEKNTP